MQPSPCQLCRGEALTSSLPPAHASDCAPCARWIRGLAAREKALRSLPRASAPAELDGRVVAAIHAGERQERAIRAMRGLGRIEVEHELDRALAEAAEHAAADPLARWTGRLQAPAVLERLVAGELADPARARAERF